MAVQPLNDPNQEMLSPQGRTIGFVDTQSECDDIIHALNVAGFRNSMITVLNGEDGIELLKRMLGGSLWGEADEDVMAQGVKEMNDGHFTLVIESETRDEAIIAANIAAKHGGHGFSHFGLLTDERLTL